MTNMTLAAIGTTEWVLVVTVGALMVGVPLAAIVLVWLWQRNQGSPSVKGSDSNPHRGV